jgi:outer membrane protein assembly factor BamB
MSAWRRAGCLAVAIVMAAAAGCTQAASSAARREPSGHAWSTPVDWPFSLAVDGDDAVVTISHNRVVDLDADDGRERWHADLAHVTHHDPALGGDTTLISADDRFVALDRDTGALRWEAAIGEPAAGAVLTRLGSEPIALVTTEPGVVAALDVRTGETHWSVQLPGDIYAAPAAEARAGAGAVVWSGDGGEALNRLRVFDLATGAMRWEIAIEPGATAPLIHHRAVVLGEGNGNFEARIVARDLASGVERWAVTVPASFESGLTPGAAGDDVVASDHFGTVTLVDARAGTARWQTPIREPILDTRVLLAAHAVALTTYGGQVVILDRGSGRIIRRVDPGGFPVGIGVSGGRLIFAVRLARPDRVEAVTLPEGAPTRPRVH